MIKNSTKPITMAILARAAMLLAVALSPAVLAPRAAPEIMDRGTTEPRQIRSER
jgi:hypothetical protein